MSLDSFDAVAVTDAEGVASMDHVSISEVVELWGAADLYDRIEAALRAAAGLAPRPTGAIVAGLGVAVLLLLGSCALKRRSDQQRDKLLKEAGLFGKEGLEFGIRFGRSESSVDQPMDEASVAVRASEFKAKWRAKFNDAAEENDSNVSVAQKRFLGALAAMQFVRR